ncbi:hypothetical protein FSP39_003609 [Pinctada imbricata]|uniref:Uncharacterized protein n=1 Tax=Pinctada imbricata TaxID=66713 RepID=A0AA88YAV1_PINIB|nr:hypothetical protein FSP39_003609 [Pinctada imbricata]
MELFIQLLAIISIFGSSIADDVKCENRFGAIVTDDCKTLYRCVWGRPIKMPSCPSGLIFSPYYHVCVYRFSQFDECQYKTNGNDKGDKLVDKACSSFPCKNGGLCEEGKNGKTFTCNCPLNYGGETCERMLTKAEQCEKDATLVTSHPEECQLYYDCDRKYAAIPSFFEQYLQECPYPQLFSEVTRKCENFTKVDCGTRKEHKSACDYRKFMCDGPNCIPCEVEHPSCEGKKDGLHPHGWKKNSPYFMICKGERFISSGQCETEVELHEFKFPQNGTCVSRYEVPKEMGGLLPDCEGKMEGSYKDEQGRCDRYFACNGGKPSVMKCPEGSSFDLEARECVEGELVDKACSSFPCKNGGLCEEGKNGKTFTCNCPLNYGGETCERMLTKAEQCEKDATLVTSHPEECQLYYDCDRKYAAIPSFFEQYLQECPYPQLFSEVTRKCENFTKVDCGTRKEHKSACDYRKFMCDGPNCIPCEVEHPSCEGKKDGLHPHGWKKNSPYFMICKGERFISSGQCETEVELHEFKFPQNGTCVSRYEVPKEMGGLLPDCEGKMEGSYKDEQGRCDRYFACNGGKPSVMKCPEGSSFDLEARECVEGGKC